MATDWRARFLQGLSERDERQKALAPLFDAFEEASRRAILVDSQLALNRLHQARQQEPTRTRTDKQSKLPASSDTDTDDSVALLTTELDIKAQLASSLQSNVKALKTQLASTERQLNIAQQRTRDMAEEDYMRTHHVQELHNEILALTMQLNLSEEKAEQLKAENKDLVDRWIKYKNAEAADMNAVHKR